MAGLDLILNASRESIACLNDEDDNQTKFERMAYINGAQHVLQGLPRDLGREEAVMLHRAMPQALGSIPAPASGAKQRRVRYVVDVDGAVEDSHADGAGGASGGESKNKVQGLILLWISCLWWLMAWTERFVGICGYWAAQAEYKKHFFAGLLSAIVWLMQAPGKMLRGIACSWPSRTLFASLVYVTEGVGGALEEVEFEIQKQSGR